MKAANVCVVGVLCLALLNAGVFGQPASAAGAGYLGISLDPQPLPPILVKHLRLDPGQGLRIVNVQIDSPADKAGLERDDIIVGLGNDTVKDSQAFAEAVREVGAGTDVALEIIHLGKRKTVTLTLAELQDRPEDIAWKHPQEPEPVESWQPGRMWFMEPGDEDWNEVPWQALLQAPGRRDVTKLFKEIYTFRQHQNGKDYSITIEGDPADEETWVTVRSGELEYKAMAKDIDELPEEYRKPVRDSLRRAREQKAHKPKIMKPLLPKMPNFKREDFFEDLRQLRPQIPNRQKDEMLDNIQEQMRQLQKEIETLQKSQKEMFERLDNNRKADKGSDI